MNNEKRIGNLVIEDAKIIFRNFAGKEQKFNPAGKRNFCVIIDPSIADNLKNDGWNIKTLRSRDPDEMDTYYLQVSVSYGVKPPKIWMVVGDTNTLMDEDSISAFDYADIAKADLVINPYVYEINGKKGVKAYVKTLYITIDRDPIEEKYSMKNNIADEEDLPF